MADSSTSSRNLLLDHGLPRRHQGHKNRRRTPWVAFALILLVIGSMAASIGIITSSHKDSVKAWRIQPAVWLSIMSAIFVVALEGLVTIGVAISWWRSITNGSTLKRLHYIWNGTNLLNIVPAFMAGVDTRKVAFAALAIGSAKFLNGPLLQRATRARNYNVESDISMRMLIAPTIDDGWFGTHSVDTTPGLQTFQNWYLNNTITTSNATGYFCEGNGTCKARVAGAGINYGCDSTSSKINLLDSESVGVEIFNISTGMSYDFGQSMLFLYSKYLSSIGDDCVAEIVTETCNIILATVEYPIIIKNTTVTLDLAQLLSKRTVIANYTSPYDDRNLRNDTWKGPLKGLHSIMGSYMYTFATLQTQRIYSPYRSLADLFYDANLADYPPHASQNCAIRFKSPTDYVFTSFFDFLLRSAIDVAQDASAQGRDLDPYTANFTAHFAGSELHYHSDFRYLAGAIVIMFLGLLAVVFLLWGWWELGRSVTLSPLETAKAFGAPILLGAGPEKEANGIMKEVGHERVAHDGEELLWNGTVYASGRWEMGQVPTVRSRREGNTGSRSGIGNEGRNDRPEASNREGTFEHSPGAKVRYYGESDLSVGGRRGSGLRTLRPLSAIDESPLGFNS